LAKIETMIGFAIRAGKIIYGAERIYQNKNAKIIIICHTLADNSKKKLLEKRLPNQKIIVTKALLEDIVYKTNCKAIAITDINFAKSILDGINGDYALIDFSSK